MQDLLIEYLSTEKGWKFGRMLKGEIKRKYGGDKTTPGYRKGWLDEDAQPPFSDACPYLLKTGEDSGVVAVDCDNQVTADIVSALAATAGVASPYCIVPIGKAGITFLYAYEPSMKKSFAVSNDTVQLDFQSSRKGLYMPTVRNKTKEEWHRSTVEGWGDLPKMPDALKHYLTSLVDSREPTRTVDSDSDAAVKPLGYPPLHPAIADAVESGKLSSSLLRILTPNKLKHNMKALYASQGYIGPGDISKGGGSTYLLAISTILGGDVSINANMYLGIMGLFNAGLQSPLDKARLDATITKPMLNKDSKVDGKPIWQFNRDWKASGLTLLDKTKNLLYVVTDAVSYKVAIVNMAQQHVTWEDKSASAAATLRVITGSDVTTKHIETKSAMLHVVALFGKPFGLIEHKGMEVFNLFKETSFLAILRDPTMFVAKESRYKRPEATLAFLRHLIPNRELRLYFVKHLRTKLTTFKFSPIIFNFTGAPGSGKDTLFRLLQAYVGTEHTVKPSPDQVMSRFNSWAENKLFVLCNEFPDSLPPSRYGEMKGKLKDFSGAPTFACEDKGKSARPGAHSITFIMAQNFAAPLADPGDRRHVHIRTPKALINWDGLDEFNTSDAAGDSMEAFQQRLHDEAEAFAYYLSDMDMLNSKEFITLPKVTGKDTIDRYEQIDNKLARLSYILREQDWDYLFDLIEEVGCEVTKANVNSLGQGFIPSTLVVDILHYWGYEATSYSITSAFKLSGIVKTRKALGSARETVYNVPFMAGNTDVISRAKNIKNDFEEF